LNGDTISIVVVVRSNPNRIRPFVEKIHDTLAGAVDLRHEVLLVAEGIGGSRGVWATLEALHAADHRVKGVLLTRDFGLESALAAGLRYATGDAVVIMSGALDDPPEMLPAMIQSWRAGYPIVSGVRTDQAGGHSTFRLMDRRVVRKLNALPERDRCLTALVEWTGFRQARVQYVANAGAPAEWSLRGALDSMTSASSRPLRMVFAAALVVTMLCMLLAGYGIYNRVAESKDLSEWSSTFVTLLGLGGVQLLMTGVVALYLGRVFDEVKSRPNYVVETKLGVGPRIRKLRRVRALESAEEACDIVGA
jgi:polyisoprenyl-phosphate glycosyltransferase